MRLAWLTDIHFDFLDVPQIATFLLSVRESGADAVVISGDIAIARTLRESLRMFEHVFPGTTYFVLGNHDFYGASIPRVRAAVAALMGDYPRLRWLPAAGVVPLTATTALIGHDGWADGRLGDYARSQVELNDYHIIAEFVGLDKTARLRMLNALGDEAAAYLRGVLPTALAAYAHVYVATHVPPFEAACWHEGRPSGAVWVPHFACGAVGDVLLEMMQAHPHRTLTVLCGHTHGRGSIAILPNLHVWVGGATYGTPEIQRVFEIQ